MRPRLPRILPIRTSSSARHLLLCLALLGASVAAGAGGARAQSPILTYPAPLNTNSDTDSLPDSNVQIAHGGGGTFLAVWESDENLGGTAGTDTDIFFSTGDGIPGNWSPPALLNTNGTSDSGGDNNVQIASDGAGHWVAVWQGHENLNGTTGTEGDILVATSADDGSTWTATALLNNNGDSDGVGDIDSHPTIASDGAGNWIAAWQSFTNLNGTTGPDLDILTATSSDNGLTWSDPALLNSSGASDSGANARDKNPHLASNGEGEWVAVWDSQTNLNGAGNDYDIFFALSSDAGASWTSAALLNSNGTTDSGIDPLSGSDTYPQVIWDGMHSWVAVWQSNEDLAGPGGSAGTDDDIFVSLMRRNAGVWSAPTVLDSNAEIDTGGDFSPRIHADGAGHWVTVWHSSEDLFGGAQYLLPGDVIVPTGFYEGSAGTDTDIFIASATSPSYNAEEVTPCVGGPCVNNVVLLNVNGTEDAVPSASDSYASIATDGSGNWVAAWSSSGDLGGTAGTDGDILFAWSNDLDGDELPADDGSFTLGYDNCPFVNGIGEIGIEPDTDSDGLGDACDPFPSNPLNDLDGDGYSGPSDNCPLTPNPNQIDSNTDGVGDVCETADFPSPALLNTNGDTDLGDDYAVALAHDNAGHWVAVWSSDEDLNFTENTDNEIFVATSADGGDSWTYPALLNTNGAGDSGSDFTPSIATDGLGAWAVVWRSNENLNGTAGTDPDIFIARSVDNGTTWTAPALLNSNGELDTGNDYVPQIIADGNGAWITIWASDEDLASGGGGTAGTDQDIFVARSADAGASWSGPALLNTNATSDSGTDDFPQIETDAGGNWVVAWSSDEDLGGMAGTDPDIFISTSPDGGVNWTAPGWVNANGNGEGGESLLTGPSIATDRAGRWLMVWGAGDDPGAPSGSDEDIFIASSENHGATWTTPALLNTNGNIDEGHDTFPSITTDRNGHWMTVWSSDEDLGNIAENDTDIFVATSADNGQTWSRTGLVTTDNGGSDEAPKVLSAGDGRWVAAWQSDWNEVVSADLDIKFAVSVDADGDEVPDVSDAFPLDPLENTDTDGDGTGNNADLDDDGDGLPDTVETGTGFYVSPSNTGTFSLIADSDGDGILDGDDLSPLDGADCRSQNPQLKLVWGRDAPFGVDHQNDPGIGHQYLMNANNTLPGLASDDVRLPAGLPASLASGLQALFGDARADYPALGFTENGLQISTLTAADPLPAVGTPGSPSLLYVIDRSAINTGPDDPDFGGLGGLAWTGVNRFSRSCTGGLGSVIIDPGAVPPITDPGYPAALAGLVEQVAHEAGHLYGLRHVLRGGLSACTGETHSGDPAVMDYFDDGALAELAQCAGPGCPVTEPPDCSGNETGEHHNPLYHYLHYVVGDSTEDLALTGVTPGSWDQEDEPLILWEVQFNFFCAACNLIPLYNVSLIEVLPGGGEVLIWPLGEAFENGGPNAYPDITIEELNQLTFTLPETSGLKLVASRIDPATTAPDAPPANVTFAADPISQAPVYPPAQRTTPVVIQAVLLEVNETSPGVFESTVLAEDPGVSSEPRYESRSDGFYQLASPEEPNEIQLTTSSLLLPGSVETTAMLTDAQGNPQPPTLPQEIPIPVPEPGTGGALLAGFAALLALRRRGRRISGR